MGQKYLLVPILIILIFSCESKLYPPTDPPVLSNIVLTSSSYTSATSNVYQGDTVFIAVDVEDPEDDPETLNVSILSGSTEVDSEEFGESRIHDGEYWEGWFETETLAIGSYTLRLTPFDKEGNEGDPLEKNFEVEDNIKLSVTIADVTITLDGDANDWMFPAEETVPDDGIDESGEPFRVIFDITNNSAVKIDLAHIKLNVEYPITVIIDEGTAVVSGIEAGETLLNQQLILSLRIGDDVNRVSYIPAESSVTIY
jgi:hypothetical protein